ncbi:MAG: cysteine desulfurase family protein [Acuticoccus sp.]
MRERGPPERLYLDFNATAPLCEAARAAVLDALSATGNASSVHAEGRAARARVESARRTVAARLGARAEGVTFTSGGTEANATALAPGVRKGGTAAERLIVSAVEHPAVLSGGRFQPQDIALVPVDADGVIDLAALDAALAADPRPALVSVMAANNETGVLQPLAEIAALAGARGAIVHSDAVQAFGRVPDEALCADLLTLSGHKIGAPAGVGVLVRRGGVSVPPLVRGGGQERGARGGTENVAAIAGFGAALAGPAATPAAWAATRAARDAFETALATRLPRTIFFGRDAPRLPNTSLFAPGRTSAELSLIGLDLKGFAVSSGSACASGKVSESHVLRAMGVDAALARAALRVSVGPEGAELAFGRFLVALTEVIVPMEQHPIS